MTPLRYQQVLRLERAEHLIGQGATVEAAARAVGFQDARMLRRLRASAAMGSGSLLKTCRPARPSGLCCLMNGSRVSSGIPAVISLAK